MIAYIDAHKERFGVEPICKQLPIAPSAYYAAKSRPPVRQDDTGRGLKARDPARAPRQLRRLRGTQGVVATRPRGDSRRPLYGRASHEHPGASRRPERRLQGHDNPRWPRTSARGSCGSRLPGLAPEPALGRRHHLRGHLERVRLRCLRHRRVLQADRRLAGVPLTSQ
jgi:hypothetical protein